MLPMRVMFTGGGGGGLDVDVDRRGVWRACIAMPLAVLSSANSSITARHVVRALLMFMLRTCMEEECQCVSTGKSKAIEAAWLRINQQSCSTAMQFGT